MVDGNLRYAASNCSSTSEEGEQTAGSNHSNHSNKSPPQTKRRASRAGTRSVSTLTPAQLQRKRANDREAQRAIRQRNKEHIDNLERRIEELSSSNVDAATLVQLRQRVRDLEEEVSKAHDSLAISRTHQTSTHPLWQARSNGELVHTHGAYGNGLMIPRTSNFGNTTMSSYHEQSPSYGSQILVAGNTEDHKGFVVSDEADLHRNWAPSTIAMENASPLNFGSQTQYMNQPPSFYSSAYGSGGSTGSSTYIAQPSAHTFDMPVRHTGS